MFLSVRRKIKILIILSSAEANRVKLAINFLLPKTGSQSGGTPGERIDDWNVYPFLSATAGQRPRRK
jgi:hypothetical protein